MSNPPPMMPPVAPQYAYADPGRRRTSAAAVASLICGIIGCFVITPIVAVICGIVGIRATRSPNVGGRGMAIAGLVLGLLWLLGFAAGGAGGIAIWSQTRGPAAAAQAFIADLAAGNTAAALARSSGLTQADVDAKRAEIAPWGALTDVTLPVRSGQMVNGTMRWELTGTATFANGGQHPVEFVVSPGPDGQQKVRDVHFD